MEAGQAREITMSRVEFPGGNKAKNTKGYLVRPKGADKFPGVIVIHEVWGLVRHIEDVAERFAKEGYAALAVDLFEGKTASRIEDGFKIRQELSEEKILGDLKAAVAYLKTLDFVNPDRIGSIGFCMGGWLSLSLALHSKELAAAVIFYGRNPTPLDSVKNLSCPILGNYGGADPGLTKADIDALRAALTKYGKKFDIKVYPGAPHAFFNDTRESYRTEAAKDAWNRTVAFFRKTLKR
ncbi:MAG: dienelactone hydrolase family protein [Candidatus Atabeyarchaeum deiterrae]